MNDNGRLQLKFPIDQLVTGLRLTKIPTQSTLSLRAPTFHCMRSIQNSNIKINRLLQSSLSLIAPSFHYAPTVGLSNNKPLLQSTLSPTVLLFQNMPSDCEFNTPHLSAHLRQTCLSTPIPASNKDITRGSTHKK